MLLLALAVLGLGVNAAESWYRGNTHAHTNRSDGNAAPEVVVAAYRDLGYDFIVITDHDGRTSLDGLGEPGAFLVISGEEVSASHEGRPLHLTAVGLSSAVSPESQGTVSEVIDRNAKAIRGAGGLPILNHPNLGWYRS